MASIERKQLIINGLLALVVLSIPFLSSPDLRSGVELLSIPPFQRSFISYFILLMFLYINYYIIIPRYYIPKRWILLSISLLTCYALLYFVPRWIIKFDRPFVMIADSMEMMPPMLDMKRPVGIFSNDSYLFQFVIIFFLSLLMRLSNHLRYLKNEQLETEISYLKAQINPHFLFNTLNSLYALTLKKSDKAPMAVLKLSNIMRYVVTENEQKEVLLKDEISYIQDYIELQKLRLSEAVNVSFEIKGRVGAVKVAPMLFMTFVENSFKYGVCQDEPSTINIWLGIIEEKRVIFKVDNTNFSNINVDVDSTNNGLKNTQKRLQHIYPNAHNLSINETEETYSVILELDV